MSVPSFILLQEGKAEKTAVRSVMQYGLKTLAGTEEDLKMLSCSVAVTRMDRMKNEDLRETEHVGCFGDKARDA